MTSTLFGHRHLPYFRLGVAAGLIVLSAVTARAPACDDRLPPDLLFMMLVVAIQAASAVVSFGLAAIALASRRPRVAGAEALTGVVMLLAIVMAGAAALVFMPALVCEP